MHTDPPDPCRPAPLSLSAAVLLILGAGLLALLPLSTTAQPESAPQPAQEALVGWGD